MPHEKEIATGPACNARIDRHAFQICCCFLCSLIRNSINESKSFDSMCHVFLFAEYNPENK